MNWFIKKRIELTCLSAITILFLCAGTVFGQQADAQGVISGEAPQFIYGEFIYADVDTKNNRLLIILNDGLWQYNLDTEQWQFLSDLEGLPDDLDEFEFAYNIEKGILDFWDRGVGRVSEVKPKSFSVERIDRSHIHKNQFKHQPFIREGNIYAFGGYGYWIWKNYITYYDRNLQEWSVQNVNPESLVPSARVPHAGAYSSSLDEFFIYGGKIPSQEQRADDQYTSSHVINDIWSFSFSENSWNKIADLDQSYQFYDPTSIRHISRVNGISSSAYSNQSNLWYIPTSTENTSDGLVFVIPIDVASGQIGKSILLPAIESNQIIPTNFLFNTNSGNLIIVGIKKITNRVEYPIEVIRISEDSLVSELQFVSSKEHNNWIYGLILILLTGLMATFYLKYRTKQKDELQKGENVFTEEEIKQIQWLKSDEKLLLEYLFDNRGFLESMKIDEAVWPDIDNYDYCRKLRNDTINSINKKFRTHFAIEVDIITRVKDPDDKRRYLYGLNEDIMDF